MIVVEILMHLMKLESLRVVDLDTVQILSLSLDHTESFSHCLAEALFLYR